MNPFELQAQFARQWFELAQSMTTNAMNAYTGLLQQSSGLWGQQTPWFGASPMPHAPTFSFPWLNGTPSIAPSGFSMPFASAPAQWNPFTSWVSLFAPKPAMPSAFPMMPFSQAMMSFWTPWMTTPLSTPTAWTAPFAATPARNPSADLIEQMATNYRTASGYAVAAVIGPLNAALDPRTYGEPWWQKLDKRKKLN